MAGISLYLAFYFDGPVLLKKTFAYLSNNQTGHASETPLACAKEIFAWPPIMSVANYPHSDLEIALGLRPRAISRDSADLEFVRTVGTGGPVKFFLTV